ncbi:MAG: YutD-like domain-containing protein [Bacilli bacterium]
MTKIVLENQTYELEKNNKDCFDLEEVKSLVTDYFVNYDYIFGDYSYNKLRLKGFYDKTNKEVKEINNIKLLDEYIKNYCAYDCKYFLLKKMR